MAVFACLSFIGLGVVMSLSRKARLEAAAKSHGPLREAAESVKSGSARIVNGIGKGVDGADRIIEDVKDDFRSTERSAEVEAAKIDDDVKEKLDRYWGW